MEIRSTDSLDGVEPEHLIGFFVGWWHPPPPEAHLRVLKGSDLAMLAFDTATSQVIGFITALTDGDLSAFIPLLEALPDYQGRGIGQTLMRLMLDQLNEIPNVDLVCNPDVVPFYERFDMQQGVGMALRRWMTEDSAS